MTISAILIPQIAATLILTAVLIISLRFKGIPEAKYFQSVIVIGLVWSLLYGLELNAGLVSDKVLFAKMRFIFLPFIGIPFFLMSVIHSGKFHWLARKNIVLLSVLPVLTVLVMLTSDYTHLFRYDFGIRNVYDFSVLTFTNGPWFWVYATYSYGLLSMAVVFLVGTTKGTKSVYTIQALVLIMGTAVPGIVDVLFNFGITPIQGYNFASSSMIVTGVLFTWAMIYYQILYIKPVARSTVVDNMSDLYLVVDANNRLVDFNRASAEKLGLGKGVGVGTELTGVLPASPAFHSKLKNGSNFVEEMAGLKAGDDLTYEASVIPLAMQEAPGNKLILLRDVTMRKRAEMDLKQNEIRYRELLDSSPFPITIARMDDGRLLFINRRAERRFKISREEALKTKIQDYYQEPSQRGVVLNAVNENGHLDDYELMMKDTKGEVFWTYTSAIAVDYQGAKAIFAEYNDISELKRLGTAVQSVNLKLNLLSTITRHDMRNDLMVIHGHIQLAETEKDPSKLSQHIGKIKVATDRMDSLIEFAKTYQSLGNEPPGWYRVEDLFYEALNQLKAPNVTASISVGDLKIFADRLVERVFYNLVDNSIRHGGHVSNITLEFQEGSDGAILAYSDDGLGIMDSDRSRLFERGFGKNTGLGLFLTREILAITGMTISEKGKQGKGVRFEIRIPKNSYRAQL
jgi:PAS domain S-box-containing protein